MIELKNLNIGYRSRKQENIILRDISARLEPGKLTCFLGKNGAGKSTLLKTILGVLEPFEGSISVEGKNINNYSSNERAKLVSAVLTDVVRTEHISVEEFVSLGRIPHTNWSGNLSKIDKLKVEDAIDICEIGDIRENNLTELSDGQLQKVSIARAICQDTELILLDEPTAHLDISNKFKVFEILRKLAIDYKKSIFIITHDLELAFQNADNLWVINNDGQLLSDLTEDLLLKEKLIDSFMTSNFEFDYKSGKFLYKRESRVSFTLAGSSEEIYWTKQALYKNGYGINESSEFRLDISDSKVWTLYQADKLLLSSKSIKELIHELNKYFFPEYI